MRPGVMIESGSDARIHSIAAWMSVSLMLMQ